MIIEIEEGKQIVTHPSGHIDIYNIEQIEALKASIHAEVIRLQNMEAVIVNELAAMMESLAPS